MSTFMLEIGNLNYVRYVSGALDLIKTIYRIPYNNHRGTY